MRTSTRMKTHFTSMARSWWLVVEARSDLNLHTNPCKYVQVKTHNYTHTYVCTYVGTYIYTHTTCTVSMCVHSTYLHICTYVRMYSYKVHMYVCTYVCMYIRTLSTHYTGTQHTGHSLHWTLTLGTHHTVHKSH